MSQQSCRILFVVESGTDIRIVNGLAQFADLSLFGRRIAGGKVVNRKPDPSLQMVVGPTSRIRFAAQVLTHLSTRKHGYDAVIVQGYGLAALAANCASRLSGIPTFMLVCSPVELYYKCRKRAADARMPYRQYQLWALKLAAATNARVGRHYVVLSRHLEEVVVEHGTSRPVSVIPIYGVDTDRFKPPAQSKVVIRRDLGLPEQGEIIFFSSRIAPEKDAETLLDAVTQIRRGERDLLLLHLSGGHEEFLEAASQRGLAERVVTRDAVDPVGELAAYYQASDVCVQASREEGLGFSPLEALACETPVVAAGVGGLKETIVEPETGWTYSPGNVAELAEQITKALDNPAEARRRAATGRKMVQERYESRIAFEALFDLISGVPRKP